MTTTEITKVEQHEIHANPLPLFSNKEVFEHSQRVALMLSKSDLIPATFKDKPANILIALELANRIGASPFMVMQNLYVIHGRPSWGSKFLIATLNASGKFSPLRYEEDSENGGRTRAFAVDKSTNEKCYGAWVSMEMAKAEGWVEKNGSKWKTMPEVMRRYRAASFFTNQFAPEVSMGIMTSDEAQEMPYIDVTEESKPEAEVVQAETELSRFLDVINSCETLEKLNKNRTKLNKYPEAMDAFLSKETELEAAKASKP